MPADGWPVVLRAKAIEVLGGTAANDAGRREATLNLGEI